MGTGSCGGPTGTQVRAWLVCMMQVCGHIICAFAPSATLCACLECACDTRVAPQRHTIYGVSPSVSSSVVV
jgi:hypothetical protein